MLAAGVQGICAWIVPKWRKPPYSGGFLKLPALWGHASSGHTKAYVIETTNKMPNGQAEFAYSDDNLVTCEKYLSSERLAAYRDIARGDLWIAIRLYERNTELSEALYGVIQGLEVSLRNAVHNVMANGTGAQDWYDKIGLEESERNSIIEAKDKVIQRPAILTPGRVVAQLTFAFWVRLMAGNYEKTLWVKYLYKIFPIKLKRTALHERLMKLKTLRNRIAHHERIIGNRNLIQDYQDILEAIGWISPEIKLWVSQTNCFDERRRKKLPKKPKPENVQPAVDEKDAVAK